MSQKHITCVGANHNSAAIEIREQLFMDRAMIDAVMPRFMESTEATEVMVLSTCNRLELLMVTERGLEAGEALQLFSVLHQMANHHQPLFESSELCQHLYVHSQDQAVAHMFMVAAGLDSLVIGETQITGQFKKAAQAARDDCTMGPVLDRLCQDALSAAKKVRTQTEIGSKPVSISHAAIDLANRVYGDIKDNRLSIIGAGEMARVAALYALKYEPQALNLINRTRSRAEELAKTLGHGDAFSWDQRESILQISDIVISSTAATDYVIDAEMIQRVQAFRHYRPLFLIDIALPRDIDPRISEIESVYLFDIDDLKQIVAEHIQERQLAAQKGQALIQSSTALFMRWLHHLGLKPALSGFRQYLDELIHKEAQKTLNKVIYRDLSTHQKDGITALLHSIAGKISSDAGSNVRTPPEGFYQEQLAAALQALFPHDKKVEKK